MTVYLSIYCMYIYYIYYIKSINMERLYLWKLVVTAQCLAIFFLKKKKTQRGISFRSRKLNKMCIMLKGVPSSVLASTVWKRVEIHSHKHEMDPSNSPCPTGNPFFSNPYLLLRRAMAWSGQGDVKGIAVVILPQSTAWQRAIHSYTNRAGDDLPFRSPISGNAEEVSGVKNSYPLVINIAMV